MEGYVQGALRKDLLMAPSIERFITATLGRSYRWILPVLWINWLKHWISSKFLLIQSYLQGALRKKLRIAPFVERFKIATLGRFCWWILPVLGINYSNMAFLSIFCWWKLMYRVLYERSCTLLHSWNALKQVLWEGLTDEFGQYLEQFTYILHFCRFFADRRLCIGCSTKRAAHCSFCRAL